MITVDMCNYVRNNKNTLDGFKGSEVEIAGAVWGALQAHLIVVNEDLKPLPKIREIKDAFTELKRREKRGLASLEEKDEDGDVQMTETPTEV